MLAVVIPARNEASSISGVLRAALKIPADMVIPVLNGCNDLTIEMVRRVQDARIKPVIYKEPLGLDVPRIAGAQAALAAGARGILFLDGDLQGANMQGRLAILAAQVKRHGTDLALSDCYSGTPIPVRNSLARQVYLQRIALNEALNRRDLGAAIPSHGPVAVSRRLLDALPLSSLGVPPLMQVHACRAGLKVEVGVCIPHHDLGSAKRDVEHRRKIAETIIGDCLQAIAIASGVPANRQGHDGYHSQRRFDLIGLTPPEGIGPLLGEEYPGGDGWA